MKIIPFSLRLFLLFFIFERGVGLQPAMAGAPFAPLSGPEGAYEFLWQEGYRDLYPPGSDTMEVDLSFMTATVAVNPSIDLVFHLGGGQIIQDYGYYGSGYGYYSPSPGYVYNPPTRSGKQYLLGGGMTKTVNRWKMEGSVFESQTLIGAQVMGLLPDEAKWSEVDLFVALKRRAVDPKKIWFHSITVGGSGTYIAAELSPAISRTKKAVDYSKFQNAVFLQLGLLRFLGVEMRFSWDYALSSEDEAFSFVLAWPLPNGPGSPREGNTDISAKGAPQGSESIRPLPPLESVDSQQ